jgi:hypothetical protein
MATMRSIINTPAAAIIQNDKLSDESTSALCDLSLPLEGGASVVAGVEMIGAVVGWSVGAPLTIVEGVDVGATVGCEVETEVVTKVVAIRAAIVSAELHSSMADQIQRGDPVW